MTTPSGADPLIGQVVDGYHILGILGRGGMGIVYKARDEALSRLVALKMIDPAFARDAVFARRFRAEARTLARLDSDHIVDIYAMRQTEAGSFIVMEHVDGYTVSDRIQDGQPMPWAEAFSIITQTLKALEHAHRAGVIHRDIKPSNIMVTRAGKVKVTDFGLAKLRQTDKDATVTQGVSGTLYYMSPEQVKGAVDLDHRSDLYSLGMTIYQMIAGALPIDRDSGEYAIMKTIVEEPLDPPSVYRADLTPGWDKVIMLALEKDPDRRYQRAQEMLEAVQSLEASSQTVEGEAETLVLEAVEERWSPDATAEEGRRSFTYLVGGVVAVAILALLGYVALPGLFGAEAPETPPGENPEVASVGEETPNMPEATQPAGDTAAVAVISVEPAGIEEAVSSSSEEPAPEVETPALLVEDAPDSSGAASPVSAVEAGEVGPQDQPAAETNTSVPTVITGLLQIREGSFLRSRLDRLQADGRLTYGRRERFSEPERCYVFLINRRTEQVAAVFAPGRSARVNLLTGETETEAQRARRRAFIDIWVAVAEPVE